MQLELARRQTLAPTPSRPDPLRGQAVAGATNNLINSGVPGPEDGGQPGRCGCGRANQAAAPWVLAASSAGQRTITRAGPDIKKGAAFSVECWRCDTILSRSGGKTQDASELG